MRKRKKKNGSYYPIRDEEPESANSISQPPSSEQKEYENKLNKNKQNLSESNNNIEIYKVSNSGELFDLDLLRKIDIVLIDYNSDNFNISDVSKIKISYPSPLFFA